MILTDGLHQIKVLINLSLVDFRDRNNRSNGSFLRVINLRHTDAISVIALGLQNEERFLKNAGRNAERTLNACSYIQSSFLGEFFFQNLSRDTSLVFILSSALIQKSPNGGVVLETHDGRDLIQRFTIIPQRPGPIGLKRPALMLGDPNLHTQIRSREPNLLSNLFFAFAKTLKLLNPAEKIAAVLVGVITRTPRISPRTSLDAIMHQDVFLNGIHSLPLLFSDFVDDFVKRDNLVHDGKNIRNGRIVEKNLVVLVDAKLHINLAGFDMVLQAEQRGVNHQLFHVGSRLAGLQIMDAKHIVPERNSVGRSEAIRRVIEDLLRRHLVADGVVHIQVERLLGFGQLLPEEDALSSKGVEHGASLSGQKFGVGISNLFLAVVDPVILACAKKCVLALKV